MRNRGVDGKEDGKHIIYQRPYHDEVECDILRGDE